ncbi:MAG TPA: hypothetical protein ENN05_01430 [Deltaproteobacteria bacterium]|nr:hypothetical protein [Deltaproteobacteria bacterium]
MQKVPIDLVKPGMILAKPVTNEKGMPLCAEGTELSANLIERLKKMDVNTLTLKGHPIDLGTQEKTSEEKIQDMKARFSRVEGDPIMEKLKDAIASAIASGGMEEEAGQKDMSDE